MLRSTASVPSRSRQPSISVDLTAADLLGQLGDLGDVGLEVGAGHEAAVHARDDRHPEVVVLAEVAPRLRQVAEVVQVEAFFASGRSIVMTHDVIVPPGS